MSGLRRLGHAELPTFHMVELLDASIRGLTREQLLHGRRSLSTAPQRDDTLATSGTLECCATGERTPMTGDREKDLTEAANMLLDARRTGTLLQDLPDEAAPHRHDRGLRRAGLQIAAGVRCPSAAGRLAHPMPRRRPCTRPCRSPGFRRPDSTVTGRYRGLEAEIAFLVGKDLPPRADALHPRRSAIAAMASCHPVIEELETAFVDPSATTSRLSSLADLQMHGGFIYGAAFAGLARR